MIPLPQSLDLANGDSPDGMVGASAPMRRVNDLIGRLARVDATVLIHGESGTGKELAARAIHRNSLRARGVESELFGSVRGAFTGATADRKGMLERADGGTVFLDEVGEFPLALQAKMLRVLQEREVDRVGGSKPIRVDVRVVAATNADLRSAVQNGSFRQDLYFRLDVVSLRLPPLRDRREDVLPLAEYFLAKLCAVLGRTPPEISPAAQACLVGYDWPGNVRELQNALERAVVLGSSDPLRPQDFPVGVVRAQAARSSRTTPGYRGAVKQFKTQLILEAIEQAQGSVTGAAEILNVHPNYLHRLVSTLDLRGAVKKPSLAGLEPRTNNPPVRIVRGSGQPLRFSAGD